MTLSPPRGGRVFKSKWDAVLRPELRENKEMERFAVSMKR